MTNEHPVLAKEPSMPRGLKRSIVGAALLLALGATAVLGIMMYQGHRKPVGNPEYVALGSSFAAELGLGELAPGAPLACQRSVNGYPQQLARSAGLSLVDMSCSGATVKHLVGGGQFFQGPQIAPINANTRLVTLTVGGNDIGYIGSLVSAGYRNRGGIMRWLTAMSGGETYPEQQDFIAVQNEIVATIAAIRRRSPKALVVVVTYPPVLPENGTCDALHLTQQQVRSSLGVAARLAEATRKTAHQSGAVLVDMATIGSGHDACSAQPWTYDLAPPEGASFHPTRAGAAATAEQIEHILTSRM
ncbi:MULTISPECIES: SGNH/GDSL hydrolase family protein [Sphingopyxis]|jgi:lysophospholipase L1-like esterase|nr:SGNH/GDSL hydrolase family protein [Sphingopyxis macrogoltabida]